MREYTVIVSADPGGEVWTAFCPAMPGALAEAGSRDNVLRTIAAVMTGWLEIAEADGYAAEDESPSLIARGLAETLEDRAEEGWDLTVETTLVRPLALAAA